jgi:hypothetical protein
MIDDHGLVNLAWGCYVPNSICDLLSNMRLMMLSARPRRLFWGPLCFSCFSDLLTFWDPSYQYQGGLHVFRCAHVGTITGQS